MAGADNILNAPYPNGPVTIKLGGYVPNGKTAAVIDSFLAPWDCVVDAVYYTYTGFTADLDAVTLVTTDDSKTIVAAADMGNDLSCVKQTLHADMTTTTGPYVISSGDIIKLSADTQGASEEGYIWAQINLRPVRSSAKKTER